VRPFLNAASGSHPVAGMFGITDQWTTSTGVDEYVSLLEGVSAAVADALKRCGGDIHAYLESIEQEYQTKLREKERVSRARNRRRGVATQLGAAADAPGDTTLFKGLPRHTCHVDGTGSDRCGSPVFTELG
jgi:hypothetical protein